MTKVICVIGSPKWQYINKLRAVYVGEFLTSAPITDPGQPAAVGALSAISLASGFQRYETAIENKFYRAINQLERLQRTRRGEFVPAPQTVDVSLHSGPEREQQL